MLNRFKVNSRSTVEQRRVKLSQTSSVAFVFSSAVVDNRQNCSRLVSALTRSVLTKAEQKQPRHPTSPWLPANTTWRHMSRYIPSSGCEGQLQFYRRSTAALPFHTNGCNYTKLMAGVCQGCCQERTHTHVKHMCARHINVPAVQCLQASGVKVANKWVLIGSFLRAALLVFYLQNPVGQKKSPERRALLIVAGVGSQLGTESHCSFRLLWCMWEEPQEMERIVRALPIFGQCLRLNLCPWADARLTEDVGRLDQSMKI